MPSNSMGRRFFCWNGRGDGDCCGHRLACHRCTGHPFDFFDGLDPRSEFDQGLALKFLLEIGVLVDVANVGLIVITFLNP